ncbi:unnamed protein product [Tilletia laevis]|uniref:Uncharacterized protein n=2 Tax=Tilletia TaxID=13289 RepID=A0A177VCJ3_9BASI|nr:hypothetical protein CF336_g2530 [Tilletia laevis]KAE8263316.1 hypothetical protein A4X03_0g1773 [Tilletia caries]KAE8206884.1 hypothetical protein CF335_g1547 [Tilletia laevis]CAD6891724.1 unnamed protein product [Tilletia caries]CAD6898450.1 unnamed protein product [Tilletia laevis]
MSLLLAPYNNGMRIGQGFNTYTQTICVDNAVVVDPERAENVVTNDGVTMRILAQKLNKASVWRQLNEQTLDKSNQDDAQRDSQLADLAAQAPPPPPPKTTEAADTALKSEADRSAAAAAKLKAGREASLAADKEKYSQIVDPKKAIADKDAAFDKATASRATGLALNADKEYAWSMQKAIGTSQIVQYSARFVDKLSEISDDMSASAALSIKTDCFGGSGSGAFLDTAKFHDSDIRFYLSVKCINQTINFKDALVFAPIRSISESDTERFTKCFGNAFISGFLEGGELNALVLIKVHNDVKRDDIIAEAKVALTKSIEIDGQGNIALAKKNIELNSEVTINVRYSGGASIKGYDEQWSIESLLAAANRFPYLVSQFPQRTYAILTKYEALRSFLRLKPPKVSPLKYENAAIYTNQLMDAYLTYQTLFKKVSSDIEDYQSGVKRFKTAPNDKARSSEPSLSPPPVSKTLKTSGLQPFPGTVAGLDLARREIRTQMNNIVREVDAIEKNPNIATQDRSQAVGKPVFVGAGSFRTLIPELEFKVRKIRNQALTNQLINKAADEAQAAVTAKPGTFEVHLFDPSTTKLRLSEVEQIKVADLERDNPDLAEFTRVSPPIGSATARKSFCTLDLGLEDPILSSVRVLCRTAGEDRDMAVRGMSVTYTNGVTIEFGDVIDEYSAMDDAADPKAELHVLSGLNASEMITSVKIEVDGDKDDSNHKVRVVGLFLVTNKGQVLNALTPGERSKMESVYSLEHFEKPITDGYVSGFWGQADTTRDNGLINRLGLVWTQAVVKDAIFDEDLPMECFTGTSLLGPATTPTKVEYSRILPDIPQFIWGLRSLQTSKGSKPTFTSTKKVDKSSFSYTLAPRDSNTAVTSGWMALPELSDTHIQCGEAEFTTNGVEQSQTITFDLPFKPDVNPTVIAWIVGLTADGDSVDVKVGPIKTSTKYGSFELKVSDSGGKFDISSSSDKRQLKYSGVTVGWLAHTPISSQNETTFLSGQTEIGLGGEGKSLAVAVPYSSNFGDKPTKHFVALSALKIPDFKSDVRFSGEPREATAQQFKMDIAGPPNGIYSAVWVSSL